MRRKIKNVIIGLGRIASQLEDDHLREKPCTHAGAITQHPDCHLAGGCDIDPGKREKFGQRWNCRYVYADIDQLLQQTEPDIVHIATHPPSHLKIIRKVISYPVKVIICEKPLAPTLYQAMRINIIARKNPLKIITNHERRYSQDYIQVKKAIDQNKYGQLLSLHASLYMGRHKKIRSVLWHDGTHLIDIIHFLTQSTLKKKKIHGTLDSNQGTAYIFSRAAKIPVIIEVGAGRDHLVFELDLSFESGRIRVGNGLYEEYVSRESPFYQDFNSLIKIDQTDLQKTGYFINMLDDAVRCVKNPDHKPVSSAKDGFNVIRFLSSC